MDEHRCAQSRVEGAGGEAVSVSFPETVVMVSFCS